MMRLTLLFALALIAALLASPASAFIAFHNLTTKAPITGAVHLPLSYTGTSIGISLRERPPGPVVVAWGAEKDARGNIGTVFPGPCTATFTPNNWNVTQAVTLANPMQASLAPEALTAPIKFQAFSSECGYKDHGTIVNLDVNRQAFPNTQCSIRIAPEGVHVSAFGEVPYHFIDQGSYFILRSDGFAIVAAVRRYSNGAPFMSRLTFITPQRSTVIDPYQVSITKLRTSTWPLSITHPPPDMSITQYRKVGPLAEQYTLTLHSGLSIQLTATGGRNPDINDILIRPDFELVRRGIFNGWCGEFDASLPFNKPMDMFRAGDQLYKAKQLALDSSTVPRTSPKYADTSLAKFVESTRTPSNLYQFGANFTRYLGRLPQLSKKTCSAVNPSQYTCKQRSEEGLQEAGEASQSPAVEDKSLFATGSAHCLDGADCDLAASDEEGADGALFSVGESNGLSDGFEDAVDQFWDELGSDEF